MTPKDFLNAVADRLQQGWTQHAVARDAQGTEVEADDLWATCWCALAAIGVTYRSNNLLHDYYEATTRHVTDHSADRYYPYSDEWVASQNDLDGQTQEVIVKLFRDAAETAPAIFETYRDDHPLEPKGMWRYDKEDRVEVRYSRDVPSATVFEWIAQHMPGAPHSLPLRYWLGDNVWVWSMQFQHAKDAAVFWMEFGER